MFAFSLGGGVGCPVSYRSTKSCFTYFILFFREAINKRGGHFRPPPSQPTTKDTSPSSLHTPSSEQLPITVVAQHRAEDPPPTIIIQRDLGVRRAHTQNPGGESVGAGRVGNVRGEGHSGRGGAVGAADQLGRVCIEAGAIVRHPHSIPL